MLRKLNEKFHSSVHEIVFILRDCADWRSRIKLFANTILFHFANWVKKTARREDVIFSANIRIGSDNSRRLELRRFAGDIFVLYEVLYYIPSSMMPGRYTTAAAFQLRSRSMSKALHGARAVLVASDLKGGLTENRSRTVVEMLKSIGMTELVYAAFAHRLVQANEVPMAILRDPDHVANRASQAHPVRILGTMV